MNYKKFTGFATVFIITCLFWSIVLVFGPQSFAKAEELTEIQDTVAEPQPEDIEDVYYKLQKTQYGQSIPVTVYIKEQQILTFSQIAGGMTPRERAAILVKRLKDFVDNCGDPEKILPEFKNGVAVIKYEDTTLLTVDSKSAKAMSVSDTDLAFAWANSIRKALGADALIKSQKLMKTIIDKNNIPVGYDEIGMASWYGGNFHGRRAADGSRFDTNMFTAAHKSLPFGSIVKVTNQRNGKSCVVKITDRGPFVKGRIIDLSKIAAKEIGMLHSGTSKVKIEVIGKG